MIPRRCCYDSSALDLLDIFKFNVERPPNLENSSGLEALQFEKYFCADFLAKKKTWITRSPKNMVFDSLMRIFDVC